MTHPHDGARARSLEVVEVGVSQPPGYEPLRRAAVPVRSAISTASIKDLRDTRVGDTITDDANARRHEPLPGYRQVKPDGLLRHLPGRRRGLRRACKDALEKLQLNDASLTYEPETSMALGFGFRCGFLGLLHMEIIQERLEREFDLDLDYDRAERHLSKSTKTDGTERGRR